MSKMDTCNFKGQKQFGKRQAHIQHLSHAAVHAVTAGSSSGCNEGVLCCVSLAERGVQF